ncbi:MAG: hypothetical protein ABIA59_06555, partial [Candidatus Latescibacterota bacterium]
MPFTDNPNYLGLIVVLGMIGAIIWARRRFTKFLLFVFIVTTLVSFGRFFPFFYDFLFKFLPFFNKFRVPVMVLIVQQTAAVILFAIGLNAVLKMERERLKKGSLYAMLASFALLIVVIASQLYWSGGFVDSIAGRFRYAQSHQHQLLLAKTAGEALGRDLLKFAIMTAATCMLFYSYSRKMIAKGLFLGMLALVSFIDFYMVDRYLVHPEKFRNVEQYRIIREPVSQDEYLSADPVATFLQKEKRFFRVFPINYNPKAPTNPFSGEFASNRYMNHGISSLGGYHAAKLANYQQFLTSLGKAMALGRFQMVDMLNVRYLITGAPFPRSNVFEPRWEGLNNDGQKRYIYENLKAFPRVFFVDSYQLSEPNNVLNVMTDSAIDLSETVLLTRRPAIEPVAKTGSRAVISNYTLNEIRVDAHADSACILVLSEVYYPRWKVEVDDRPGEIMQANHVLRAVALSPGDHTLVFSYDASLFQRGVMISLLTFTVLCIALGF